MNRYRWIILILMSFFMLMHSNPLFAEDQTILLDESLIVGTPLEDAAPGPQKRIAGPALSTALQWEGESSHPLDIPKEILDHLTQSDLSFFKHRENGADEIELFEDETDFESD